MRNWVISAVFSVAMAVAGCGKSDLRQSETPLQPNLSAAIVTEAGPGNLQVVRIASGDGTYELGEAELVRLLLDDSDRSSRPVPEQQTSPGSQLSLNEHHLISELTAR